MKDFEFWRIGWQYFLPDGDVVDLEIIEDKYPSIELKSETDDGLRALLINSILRKKMLLQVLRSLP